jgi:hypothetical protein
VKTETRRRLKRRALPIGLVLLSLGAFLSQNAQNAFINGDGSGLASFNTQMAFAYLLALPGAALAITAVFKLALTKPEPPAPLTRDAGGHVRLKREGKILPFRQRDAG